MSEADDLIEVGRAIIDDYRRNAADMRELNERRVADEPTAKERATYEAQAIIHTRIEKVCTQMLLDLDREWAARKAMSA